MDGLIVLKPYARMIIDGEKKFEYRKYKPPSDKIYVPIYLISEKKVLGIITITNVKYNQIRHIYFWYIKILKKYRKPKYFNYKNGQQIWAKDVILDGSNSK